MSPKTPAYQRLYLTVLALAVLCSFTAPVAVIALVRGFADTGEAVEVFAYIAETEAEIETETEEPEPFEISEIILAGPSLNEALIPIHTGMGIFYDGENERLLLPPGEYTVESGYFFNWHRVHTPGGFPAFKRVSLPGGLASVIHRQGNSLIMYGTAGYFAEYIKTDTESYIQLACPKDKYAAVVVIDPGHGGEDSGAPGLYIHEKDANLAITLALMEIFNREDIRLLPTRTRDVFITKADRYGLANAMGDYFISIHNNADERSRRTQGTETFYNAGESPCGFTGRDAARLVQNELVARLQSRDRGIEETREFSVLINARIPAVMAEVRFISNHGEEARLADPETVLEIALALKAAIERLPLREY
jgi:N-acetylmuramoyl-L-alanine amidase